MPQNQTNNRHHERVTQKQASHHLACLIVPFFAVDEHLAGKNTKGHCFELTPTSVGKAIGRFSTSIYQRLNCS
jgi:hypothetical protein